MVKRNVHRIKKAVDSRLHKEKLDQKQVSKIKKQRFWRFLSIAIPIIALAVLYLLCIWGVFCITDMFKIPSAQYVGKNPQRFILNGDILKITEGNSVDLSNFHEYYVAGDGLQLVGYEFSLSKTGVTPGTYGSAFEIPKITVDEYGRIIDITAQQVNIPPAVSINDMYGPDFQIKGTEHQVYVGNDNDVITLTLPQDIHTEASPTFKDLFLSDVLHLGTMIADSNGNLGGPDQVLVSDGTTVTWQDIDAVTSDDQTLSWDPNTFDLSIENGNTVNLSSLAIWRQANIGGYYSTDYVTPRSTNVQRIFLNYTGWGLTELQVRNEDNSDNYSGAVLTLKGSGPDYTNNMFFAKLGDSYYVPSWAGKGVVSTDQPLIIASVKSRDRDHPNNNPYIMFQTGGYYTEPVDRMILDSEGRLGIGDFNPDDLLTVAGNIHLTGKNPGIIHANLIDLELTTEPSRFGGGDIVIHPGDFAGNSGTPKDVYIYPGKQVYGIFGYATGNLMLLTNRSNETLGHLMVGVNSDTTGEQTLAQFVLNNDPHYKHLVYLVRYADNVEDAPYLDFLRYRGNQARRKDAATGDYIGGIRGYTFTSGKMYHTADITFVAQDITKNGVGGQMRFNVSDTSDNLIEAMRILDDGTIGVGIDHTDGQLTVSGHDGIAINIMPYEKEPTALVFTDGPAANYAAIMAPEEFKKSYELILPQEQGSLYDVMYNDGNGNLNWDSVQHLLSINVGDHAVLYSNGSNIVGDAKSFYWDYDNNRLGINLEGDTPLTNLHVRATGNSAYGLLLEDATSGSYPKMMVYAKGNDPLSSTRIQIDTGAISGFFYGDQRWSIGRDEFGSARAGIRLNHRNGMWANGNSLHLIAGDYDAFNIQTLGNRYIVTNSKFNFGIGTTSPSALLQVGEAGDGTYGLANAWQTFSDEKLKTDIKNLSDGTLAKVLKLRPVAYKWKNRKDRSTQIGFIAQEVQKVFPEIVKKLANGIYTIDYSKISVYLTKAIIEIYQQVTHIQEQVNKLQNRVALLEQENKVLKDQLTDLQKRVKALEQRQTGNVLPIHLNRSFSEGNDTQPQENTDTDNP